VYSCFSPSLALTDLLCHSLLQDGIRSLLGSIGLAKCCLQLLHWDGASGTAIVSTRSEMSVGARAAWMLMGSYQQKTVRIDVQQQSLFLAAIATGE
jgi:RNase P/RNase MRP subunit POP5